MAEAAAEIATATGRTLRYGLLSVDQSVAELAEVLGPIRRGIDAQLSVSV